MARKIGMAVGLALACSVASWQTSAQDPKQFSGLIAFYSKGYKGRTASGEIYDPKKFTAAHRTLPFSTDCASPTKRPIAVSWWWSMTVDRSASVSSSTFRSPPPRRCI
jgi:hypothetical protein